MARKPGGASQWVSKTDVGTGNKRILLVDVHEPAVSDFDVLAVQLGGRQERRDDADGPDKDK